LSRASRPIVILRGGGDLATGVAARLHRCGFDVILTEMAKPRAVRRLVALAEAVYQGRVEIEDLRGQLADSLSNALDYLQAGTIPVMVDPEAKILHDLEPVALVDGRMRKIPPEIGMESARMVVGLGPGFDAGVNCHAVVETMRGHYMGRVFWQGCAQADTGVPEAVRGHDVDRVLRAPASGLIKGEIALGKKVSANDIVAHIDGNPLRAPFDGALRGLLHDGLEVEKGEKVGDLDPRGEVSYCFQISDKSLAIGGGVLEALLSQVFVRNQLSG
jgi:xanthine dehydrogenase accessory factor